MLTDELTPEFLSRHLLPHGQWKPCGTIEERAFWEQLPEAVRGALVEAGESAEQAPWPRLSATMLLGCARRGERAPYEKAHHGRREILQRLVLAECVENRGRFLDPVADAVWSICEESFWGWPAHIGGLPDVTDHQVDLGVGESASLIAWSRYLLVDRLDRVSDKINARMFHETHARMLTPCLERDLAWMGFPAGTPNNWNPWICSNWVTAVLVFETDHERRVQHMHKIARAMDRFLAGYGEDGGCDEGPGYWGRAGASLIEALLRIEQALDVPLRALQTTKLRNMARFVYHARISADYAVNFGDASSRVQPEAALVRQLAELTGDEQLRSYAATLRVTPGTSGRGSIARVIQSLTAHSEEPLAADPAAPWLDRDVYLPSIQVAVARIAAGSTDGLTLAANAGHNDQSHNHNDVGSFLVYADGLPLLMDVGVETYTQKTFSPQRYDIWTMQSQWHNLPQINGIDQAAGKEFAAKDIEYDADQRRTRFAFDLADAYPNEAKVTRWRRELVLDRTEGYVQCTDRYELEQVEGATTLHFMTPCEVNVQDDGVLRLREAPLPDDRVSGSGVLCCTPADEMGPPEITVEDVEIRDSKLQKEWGSALRRIRLAWPAPPREGQVTVRITHG
ncbi:MAG: heparinase II/III domain-containing protein [Phycisphaeraceae bacterium]